jgi:hypothetical protein
VSSHKVEDVLGPDRTWYDRIRRGTCLPWHGYEYDLNRRVLPTGGSAETYPWCGAGGHFTVARA